MPVALAIDIETSGGNILENYIISIGYYVSDGKTTLAKARIDMSAPVGCVFDKRCKEEFWDKHPDKLIAMQVDTYTPEEGIKKFISIVDGYDEKYDNLAILTDCPTFDIGFIDYYLAKYLKRMPLTYKKDQRTFRPITDTDSYFMGRLKQSIGDNWACDSSAAKLDITMPSAVRDHFPENDAEYIYKMHAAMAE